MAEGVVDPGRALISGNLNVKNAVTYGVLADLWRFFGAEPVDWLTVTGGRFGNPFMSTDLVYSSDLNFDGIAAKFEKKLASNKDLTLFGTLGLIPLEYSSDNSPSRSQDKAKSENKWLLGAQFGADWKIEVAVDLGAT